MNWMTRGDAADADGHTGGPASTGPPGPAGSPALAHNPQEPPRRLVYATALGLAVIWLLLDQATKVLALAALEDGAISLGPVDLNAVKNQGGAFGLDPGFFPGLFIVVTIAVVLLIARALPRTDRLSLASAYGLIAGGALGNLVDRLFREPGFPRGAVVDFVDLGWWPVFNVADVGIVVGALVLALLLVKVDRQERAQERRDEEESRTGKREARSAKREVRKAKRQAKRDAKRERKGKAQPAEDTTTSPADRAVGPTAGQGDRAAGTQQPVSWGS